VAALLPRVDSEYIGVHLLEVTAAWAGAVGLNEDSVRLDAACAAQMRRTGRGSLPDPQELERAERTQATLDAAALQDLQRAGSALSYRDALGQVAELLGTAAEG